MKGPEGVLCTWTIEGMDYETLIDFCINQKKEWECTSVAIFKPAKIIIGAWSLVEMI